MRHLLAVALMLAACNALAGWCGPDVLYFYSESNPANCQITLVPYQEDFIEVYLESNSRPGPLAQVHFRAENWLDPGEPPQGLIKAMWTADTVVGDLATGITLSWDEGLAPELAFGGRQDYHLGTISVLALAENWAGPQHLVFLRDVSYRSVAGEEFRGEDISYFTFNGDGGYGACVNGVWDPPLEPACSWTLVWPPDGSSVGGDFVFRGVHVYYSCWMEPLPVSVTVKLNGMVIGEHEGIEELHVEQLVHLAGIGDGESFTITVEPGWGWPCETSYTYTYTLDTTAAKPESFSAIKARY